MKVQVYPSCRGAALACGGFAHHKTLTYPPQDPCGMLAIFIPWFCLPGQPRSKGHAPLKGKKVTGETWQTEASPLYFLSGNGSTLWARISQVGNSTPSSVVLCQTPQRGAGVQPNSILGAAGPGSGARFACPQRRA